MYLLKIKPVVFREDLPLLPLSIQDIFADLCEVLKRDPINCDGLHSEAKQGQLRGYRSLALEDNGIAYRLIYRVYDKPAPRRMEVIAFGEHDLAYGKAQERK